MKKVYGLIIKGVLVAGLLVQCLPVSTVVHADNGDWVVVRPAKLEIYSLQINAEDNQQTIQTQGFMQDGLIMVSAADLLNNTGFTVEKLKGWREEYKAERNGVVSNTIFNNFSFSDASILVNVNLKESLNGYSHNEMLLMPTLANFTHGRLYVPLQFFSSLLNYDVKYDESTHVITLDYWGDQKKEETEQVKKFVSQYMATSLNGYNADHSLYTSDYLEREASWLDYNFSDGEWPESNLMLKDWNIRYLFFISKNEAMVKIPYWEEGKVSRKIGGLWLRILHINGEWKVDSSSAWSQSLYLDNINQQVENLKIQSPQIVKTIKKSLYASYDAANAKKQDIGGNKIEYKTFLKNINVLYADDHIAYIDANYNWSFKPTNENFKKYNITPNGDFITMEKDTNGKWKFKEHTDIRLDYPTTGTTLRGNYDNSRNTTFNAFDDYYLNDPSVRPYISFF